MLFISYKLECNQFLVLFLSNDIPKVMQLRSLDLKYDMSCSILSSGMCICQFGNSLSTFQKKLLPLTLRFVS